MTTDNDAYREYRLPYPRCNSPEPFHPDTCAAYATHRIYARTPAGVQVKVEHCFYHAWTLAQAWRRMGWQVLELSSCTDDGRRLATGPLGALPGLRGVGYRQVEEDRQ